MARTTSSAPMASASIPNRTIVPDVEVTVVVADSSTWITKLGAFGGSLMGRFAGVGGGFGEVVYCQFDDRGGVFGCFWVRVLGRLFTLGIA